MAELEKRFDAIRSDVMGRKDLRGDSHIKDALGRIAAKFKRARQKKTLPTAMQAPPSALLVANQGVGSEANKVKLEVKPKLKGEVKTTATVMGSSLERRDGVAALQGRFKEIRGKIMANAELSGDKAIRNKLSRISAKLERATHAGSSLEQSRAISSLEQSLERHEGPRDEQETEDEDELTEPVPAETFEEDGDATPSVQGALERWEAVKDKVFADEELSANPRVAQHMRQIEAKMVNMEKDADEDEAGDGGASLERRDGVAALQGRFKEIRGKIMANAELSGDKAIRNKLSIIASKLERASRSRAISAKLKRASHSKGAGQDEQEEQHEQHDKGMHEEDEDGEHKKRLEQLEKRFTAIKGKLLSVKSFRSAPRIQKQLHKIETQFERAKADLETEDHAMQPFQLA